MRATKRKYDSQKQAGLLRSPQNTRQLPPFVVTRNSVGTQDSRKLDLSEAALTVLAEVSVGPANEESLGRQRTCSIQGGILEAPALDEMSSVKGGTARGDTKLAGALEAAADGQSLVRAAPPFSPVVVHHRLDNPKTATDAGVFVLHDSVNDELCKTYRKDSSLKKVDEVEKGENTVIVRFDSAYFANNVGSDVLRSLRERADCLRAKRRKNISPALRELPRQ